MSWDEYTLIVCNPTGTQEVHVYHHYILSHQSDVNDHILQYHSCKSHCHRQWYLKMFIILSLTQNWPFVVVFKIRCKCVVTVQMSHTCLLMIAHQNESRNIYINITAQSVVQVVL